MINEIFTNKKIMIFLIAVMLLSALFTYNAYAYSIYTDYASIPQECIDYIHSNVNDYEYYVVTKKDDYFCVGFTNDESRALYLSGTTIDDGYWSYLSFHRFYADGTTDIATQNYIPYDSIILSKNVANITDVLPDELMPCPHVVDYQHSKQVYITSMPYIGFDVAVKGIGTGILRVENVGTGEVRYVSLSAPVISYIVPVEYDNTYNISYTGSTTSYVEFWENSNYTVNDIMNLFTMSTGNTYMITTSEDGYIEFFSPKSGVYYSLQKNEADEMAYLLDSDSLTDYKQNLNNNTEYYFRIEVLPNGSDTVTIQYEGELVDCIEELTEVPDEVLETVLMTDLTDWTITYDIYKTNLINNFIQFKNISDESIQINLSSTGDGYGMLYTRDYDSSTETTKDVLISSFSYDDDMRENFIRINSNDYIELFQESGEMSLKVADIYEQNTDYTLIKVSRSWSEVIANNPALDDVIDTSTPTNPETDLGSNSYDDNPYIDKSEAQVWFENSQNMSITEALGNIGTLNDTAQSFFGLISGFMTALPSPIPEVFGMIIVGGIAVFFIKLIL